MNVERKYTGADFPTKALPGCHLVTETAWFTSTIIGGSYLQCAKISIPPEYIYRRLYLGWAYYFPPGDSDWSPKGFLRFRARLQGAEVFAIDNQLSPLGINLTLSGASNPTRYNDIAFTPCSIDVGVSPAALQPGDVPQALAANRLSIPFTKSNGTMTYYGRVNVDPMECVLAADSMEISLENLTMLSTTPLMGVVLGCYSQNVKF